MAAVAMAFTLGACSTGGAGSAPSVDTTPKVSLDASASSTSEPGNVNFASAVDFTRLVHIDEVRAAGNLVADSSPGARYIAHLNAVAKFHELNGDLDKRSENDVSINSDEKTGSVRIELTDGDKPSTYTWRDFKYDTGGKILSWSGKSGPVDGALWRKRSTVKTHGVRMELISAYVNNGGNLIIVLELSSADRAIRVDNAAYTPRSGYRQRDGANYYTDVDKGEKALTLFQFNGAKLGGTLKVGLGRIDPTDSSSSYALGAGTLAIK